MSIKSTVIIILMALFTNAFAQEKVKVDIIVTHAKIFNLNKVNKISEAMVIDNGKIISTGSEKDITTAYAAETQIDAGGKYIYPGFIDAHSHFRGFALSLQQADLTGTLSYEEVLSRVKEWAKDYPGEWVTGRGWDNNRWKDKSFPTKAELDRAFPDRPVVLIRVDGHMVLANSEAIKRSGIGNEKGFTEGEVEIKNGLLTGILTENAADFIRNSIPDPDDKTMEILVSRAEELCFEAGLTCVNDAGLDKNQILFFDSLQKNGKLKIRLTVMLNPTEENFEFFVRKGIYQTENMSVRSVKLYADGSLGSRSALLKKPYSDAPEKFGITTTSAEKISEAGSLAMKYGYQVNVHAIGDSAVKNVLDIYASFLKGKNDLRWRIEHSQVVDPADMDKFGKYSVIPSVQATHATSDMTWAVKRLGPERMKGAYAYRDLMKQNGWIPNGTDFPIEGISPLNTFYAAVARKDLKGMPSGGFQKENALTREEALRSVTIWAAMADFSDNRRGSLEPGKDADFVILDKDIMEIPENEIPGVKVLQTYLAGELVFPVKK